jgi:hypothetical protein
MTEELKLRPTQIHAIRCLYEEYLVEDPTTRSYYNLRAAVKEVLNSFQEDFNLGA